jgi:hypothetical protein
MGAAPLDYNGTVYFLQAMNLGGGAEIRVQFIVRESEPTLIARRSLKKFNFPPAWFEKFNSRG